MRTRDMDEPFAPNPRLLWHGGVATALVATLIVVVEVAFVRGVLGVPVLAPSNASGFGNATTSVYAALAAAWALAATALLHLLLLSAPRPLTFFTWIAVLAGLATVVAPFTWSASLPSKVTAATINLTVGIAVVTLLSGVARSALNWPRTVP